jgi:DNA-binding response OmpR family regulator
MRGQTVRHGTILIVEHDEPTAVTYARILQLAGFTVQVSFSAHTVFDELVSHSPDAILVDLRMPVMDGLQFLRELRTHPSHGTTPVAIVTGDYQLGEELTTQLQALGAVVRFKPLWIDDLTMLAEQLMAQSRS